MSAETLLTADVNTGGSQTLDVKDNSKFKVGDPIVMFDDLTPSKDDNTEGFETLFQSNVIQKIGTTQIVLQDTVPDTFLVDNCTRIVSNATLQILMFHFVDHKTRDLESAQYWVHEFTFWVQAFVDRLGKVSETGVGTGVVTDIDAEYQIGVDC